MQASAELDDLNEYQRAAVLDNSPACLVNANVGSGKTTVLIAKIRYLHEQQGIAYEDMVVLTFTNKAAGEIRERLGLENGGEPADLSQFSRFGTFHSIAMALLKEGTAVETFGYTPDFSILTPEDKLELAKALIVREKLKIKYKNRLAKRLEQETENKYGDDLERLKELIQGEKHSLNQMEYDELIQYAACLLRQGRSGSEEKSSEAKSVEVRSAEVRTLTAPPKWIIVDEVQDSDSAQLELLDAMMGPETRLFAVGDPNQMIYSWRGSVCNVFFTLKKRYKAVELSLPVNYRSSEAILRVARAFQQSGNPLVGKENEKMVTADQETTVTLRRHYDSFQEADYLADRVRELHESGVPYSEIAILYRVQTQSEILAKVFARNEIPFAVFPVKAKTAGPEGDYPEQTGQDADCEVQREVRREEQKKTQWEEQGGEQKEETRPAVSLMTLHASKGLEFSHVFLIGVNNGLIPLSGKGDLQEEEERRLFYVGMTRAKEFLELSYYTNPDSFRGMPGESRFLRQIPPRFLQRENEEKQVDLRELKRLVQAEKRTGREDETIAENQATAGRESAAQVPEQSVQLSSALSQKTETDKPHSFTHPRYGTGIIVREDELMCTVDFPDYGEKEFMKGLFGL